METRNIEAICKTAVVAVFVAIMIFFGVGLYSKIAKTVDIITEKNQELFQDF